MTFREADKLVREAGWYHVGQRGSHHYYKHPELSGKLTIPEHGSKDLKKNTEKEIRSHLRKLND